ncbi:hypothetical protein HAX54_040110 [Datura stramonium]|uniref:Uncharacterized protein n=1 Tax=Datura stramonium TaxID=4076 RepID=A0ABS8SJM2_DATST|nr:hypothetical protein [Datura stramonium]
MSGGEYSDRNILLRSNSSASDGDLEGQFPHRTGSKGITDLLKRLDSRFSNRRSSSVKRSDRDHSSSSDHGVSASISGNYRDDEILGDSAPPEWALLLVDVFWPQAHCSYGLIVGLVRILLVFIVL